MNIYKILKKNELVINDVKYLLANINYTTIVTKDNKKFISATCLSRHAPTLPDNFLFISKSCIINEHFLQDFTGDFPRNVIWYMNDGQVFKGGRVKMEKIFTNFQNKRGDVSQSL